MGQFENKLEEKFKNVDANFTPWATGSLSTKDIAGDISVGASGQNGGYVFGKSTLGYNSDVGTPKFHDGKFAELSYKKSLPFQGPNSPNGMEAYIPNSYHQEINRVTLDGGYRINSQKNFHENLGGVVTYVGKNDNNKIISFGGKAEICNKRNFGYVETGLQTSSKSGVSPYVGIGTRLSIMPHP